MGFGTEGAGWVGDWGARNGSVVLEFEVEFKYSMSR